MKIPKKNLINNYVDKMRWVGGPLNKHLNPRLE